MPGLQFLLFIKRKTNGGNKITPPPRLMALTLSWNLNPLRKRTFINDSNDISKTDLKNSGTLKTVTPKTVTLKSSSFFDGP